MRAPPHNRRAAPKRARDAGRHASRPSSSKAVSHAGPENPDQLDSAHAPGGLLGRQAERRDVIVDKRGGTRQAAIRANRRGQSRWQAERTRGPGRPRVARVPRTKQRRRQTSTCQHRRIRGGKPLACRYNPKAVMARNASAKPMTAAPAAMSSLEAIGWRRSKALTSRTGASPLE